MLLVPCLADAADVDAVFELEETAMFTGRVAGEEGAGGNKFSTRRL